jgi:hypothetical protein
MLEAELTNIFSSKVKSKARLLLELNVYKLKSLDLFKNTSAENFSFIKSLFYIPCSLDLSENIVIINMLENSLNNDLKQLKEIKSSTLYDSYLWRIKAGAFWVNTFRAIANKNHSKIKNEWNELREVAQKHYSFPLELSEYTDIEEDHSFYRRAIRMSEDESIPSLEP